MNQPLHPALVHLPLGLAIVMPLVAGALTFFLWRGQAQRREWVLAVALQALLLGGGIAAFKTGERDEHRVEAIVGEHAIEEHEDQAKVFLVAAGATLLLGAAVVAMPRGRLGRGAALLFTAGTFAVAGLGLLAGKAGGELVYQRGAASAYSGTTSGGQPATPPRREHDR